MAEIRRSVHRSWLLLTVAAILLAGCSEPEPASGAQAQVHDEDDVGMAIAGHVLSTGLEPIAGATVTLREHNETLQVGPDGSFRIDGLEQAFYTITADAPDHAPQTLTATPQTMAELRFILSRTAEAPYSSTVHYPGHLQCAGEYGIVSGSCGRVLDYVGQPDPFEGRSIFDHGVDPNWATIVVDVVWDEASSPGIDGLRVTAKAITDDDALTSYEQYGRFHDQQSFTFRLEPGGNYTDGTGPVPGNATFFQFDVFPQGRGYHTVCTPDNPARPAECFLGLGAAVDLRFDLYVTTFYVEKAPQGYTIQ